MRIDGRVRLLAASVAVVVLLAGCGGSFDFSIGGQSPGEAAIELIEGDAMAQRLGLPSLTATVCDEPETGEIDDVFECFADASGKPVRFLVTIESEDQIFAAPTNVVSRNRLDSYATSAVKALNEANEFGLPSDAMDCGTKTVVLGEDDAMICVLTDRSTGLEFDAAITISDIDRGTFDVEILDPAE